MIAPQTIEQLLAFDPLAPLQAAIVSTLATLNPGLHIVSHPGKVDLSELVGKTVVRSPGVGIGWSRIREAQMAEGHFCLMVEWVAYITAEAKNVASRRVEKEALALAIGARLLTILADTETAMWGLSGVLPPETTPPAEFKPLFTVRDQSQGMAYYTVTWTQIIADLGSSALPEHIGRYDEAAGLILYDDAGDIDDIAPWIPAQQVADDA